VLIIGCSLFLADCRADSFARILRLFQAEKRSTLYLPERERVIIELGWFIPGRSILLFPCRSLLRGRPRSLIALVSIQTRNGAVDLCARRVISDNKSG
jgi:hypothetical protein